MRGIGRERDVGREGGVERVREGDGGRDRYPSLNTETHRQHQPSHLRDGTEAEDAAVTYPPHVRQHIWHVGQRVSDELVETGHCVAPPARGQ